MIRRASETGELAARVLARGRPGVVTRVFSTSAYLRSKDDFVLVLRGRLRSPMTINLGGEGDSLPGFRVGEEWAFAPRGMRSGTSEISVEGAPVHRSALRNRRPTVLPAPPDLAQGAGLLRSMYGLESGPTLLTDDALKEFVRDTLTSFAQGDSGALSDWRRYLPLIGRGGGFTPAGDDFVAGFLATFNYVARSRRSSPVRIPKAPIFARTVPESAAIVTYAIRGHVDEGLGRLVLASLDEVHPGFRDELLDLGRRGHTSGIDMALGVLLCEAALGDARGRSALKGSLRALWGR